MNQEDIARIFQTALPQISMAFERDLRCPAAENTERARLEEDYGAVHASITRLGLMLNSPAPIADEEFREAFEIIASRREAIQSSMERQQRDGPAELMMAFEAMEERLLASSSPLMPSF